MTEAKTADGLKIWSVEVELRIVVPIAARTEKEARALALDHYEEEIDNGTDPDVAVASAYEITEVGDFAGALPYGIEDEDPRRDWSIDRWLAETNEADESDPAG